MSNTPLIRLRARLALMEEVERLQAKLSEAEAKLIEAREARDKCWMELGAWHDDLLVRAERAEEEVKRLLEHAEAMFSAQFGIPPEPFCGMEHCDICSAGAAYRRDYPKEPTR